MTMRPLSQKVVFFLSAQGGGGNEGRGGGAHFPHNIGGNRLHALSEKAARIAKFLQENPEQEHDKFFRYTVAIDRYIWYNV